MSFDKETKQTHLVVYEDHLNSACIGSLKNNTVWYYRLPFDV